MPYDMIIVNASFRSGSTYFWRMLKKATYTPVYYEPLNKSLYNLARTGSFYDQKSKKLHGANVWEDYEGRNDAIINYFEKTCYSVFPQEPEAIEAYFKDLTESGGNVAIFQTNRLHFSLDYFLKKGFKVVHLIRSPFEVYESMINGMSNAHSSWVLQLFSRIYHRNFNTSPFELLPAYQNIKYRLNVDHDFQVTKLEMFLFVWIISNHAALRQVKEHGGRIINYNKIFDESHKRNIENEISNYLELNLVLKELRGKQKHPLTENHKFQLAAKKIGLIDQYCELLEFLA